MKEANMRNLIVAAVAGSIFLMGSIGASVVADSSPYASALLVAAGDGNHMTEGRAAADKQPAWPGCDFGPGFDPVAPANTKSA
jgi:hypothetical protein